MTKSTTLTSKGQVTVPKAIRDGLRLKAGDELAFHVLSDGTVVMRPRVRTVAEIGGMLYEPNRSVVSVESMRVDLDTENVVPPVPRGRALT